MLPDFNRLRVFYYIYKEKSSAAAAQSLHITPSGVSQHLKKLEDELGLQLFTRVNRSLVPTAAGQRIFEIMQGFIAQLEDGLSTLDIVENIPSGRLRVGAPTEFGRTYMPRIFAAFRKLYPRVSLQLDLGDPNELFLKVASGELDFAYIDILPILLEAPGGLSVYDVEPVVTEELILACSSSYYNEHVENVSYDALVALEYINYKTDISLFRSWFANQFDREVASLNLSLVVDSAGAVVAAMEEGVGLGIVVSHLISSQLAEGSLVEVSNGSQNLQNTIACVRFRDKEPNITETVFQQFLKNELKEIANILSPSETKV